MKLLSAALATVAALLAPRLAGAHVSIASGPATANQSQKITFSVGHGCDGLDTFRLRILIPTGLSSVRAMRSDFGTPTVERNDAGDVTAIVWQKPVAELQAADIGFYEVTLRARVADVPFNQIPFVVEQICRPIDDEDETTVEWSGKTAPILTVVPTRQSGWNQYTLAAAVPAANLGIYFGNAQIVWRGSAAYSPNAAVMALIAATPGVTPLDVDLAAGDELWVKY